jgi:rubredoxin
MIIYELVCPHCKGIIEKDVDELKFIQSLMNAERVICSNCGYSFEPEDSDYRGTKTTTE